MAATAQDQLDRAMEIDLAVRQALGQRDRVAGFDQHVQSPADDPGLLAIYLYCFHRSAV